MSSNKIISQVSNNTDQLNKMYPVGSIYISVKSTNPSNFLDGQWEQLKDKFLLACGDSYVAGSTGGEATHQLTINEIPSHNHTLRSQQWFNFQEGKGEGDDNSIFSWKNSDTGGTTSKAYINETEYSGNNYSHNNMPPYLSVYVWKRIS